ncbi:alpha-glucosidase [Marinilactibacillus psychrotolerans]|uniref:glycoside hydrolase family 13 protein n=1 Tax=Marinilactibacillus psychrotolerans TaxID=191770 RepID=UPI001C7D5216|nr:alpha-glucosidase [Marinilactibacillus psychrotolerans]GEQ33967.1 alpha-glucosidase [Marinilactibacillus psychrotolerans]
MENTQINSEEIIYQIYPKSFLDTNHDGIGDLNGVIQRLDYIKELGVTAIWLNPIFTSPHVDNGYDISDYYTVDPQYGNMTLVARLIDEAHKRGLKILFDLVLNHTSSKHYWFQEALKGPDNPYRDYYIWKEEEEKEKLPNNWKSFFGGSVWEKESEIGAYYFHLFDKEMPDLNWQNEAVRKEMIKVAEFWLDKGIDGYRLDAFIHMEKAGGYPDARYADPGKLVSAEEFFANLPQVDDYLREFSARIRETYPNAYLLGEAASAVPERAVNYTFPKGKACDSIVSFKYFPMDEKKKDDRFPLESQEGKLNVTAFKQVMDEWQRKVGEVSEMTLYLNNHDMQRAVSRLGDPTEFREESAKTLAVVMYLQRGVPVMLNGEEIGMKNLELKRWENTRIERIHEVYATLLDRGISKEEARNYLSSISINASRGAMQWNDERFAGFSTVEPWSGVNQERMYNVAVQEVDPSSILTFYKRLIQVKKKALFTHGAYEMLVSKSPIMSYRRIYEDEQAIVLSNLSGEPQKSEIDLPLFSDQDAVLIVGEYSYDEGAIMLSPYASLVIKTTL